MRTREEQVSRLAERRRAALGGMSDAAYQELLAVVREKPRDFVDCPEEEAFAKVVDAIERYDESCADDDLLDDDQYLATRKKRMARMRRSCEDALSIDPTCTDARLILELARDLDAINKSEGDSIAASIITGVSNGKRSFKVTLAPPQGVSYAKDIAEKYGVTFDKIKDTIDKNQLK